MKMDGNPEFLNTYEMPSLRKLEPGEAKDFLLQHAGRGDAGAKEILNLTLPISGD
jgi:hypothetical protein